MTSFPAFKPAAWAAAAASVMALATAGNAQSNIDVTPGASCKLDMARFQNPEGVKVHPDTDPAALTWMPARARMFNKTKTAGHAVVAMTLYKDGSVNKIEVAEECSTTKVSLGRPAMSSAYKIRWTADDDRSLEGVTVYYSYKYPEE